MVKEYLKFVKPVYIDDTITVTVIVQEIKDNIIKLKTIVVNQDDAMCVTGEAKVMI